MRLTKTRRPLQEYTPKGPEAAPRAQTRGPSAELAPEIMKAQDTRPDQDARPDDAGSFLDGQVGEAQTIETRRGVPEGDTLLPLQRSRR